jgi:hypothetical protein
MMTQAVRYGAVLESKFSGKIQAVGAKFKCGRATPIKWSQELAGQFADVAQVSHSDQPLQFGAKPDGTTLRTAKIVHRGKASVI